MNGLRKISLCNLCFCVFVYFIHLWFYCVAKLSNTITHFMQIWCRKVLSHPIAFMPGRSDLEIQSDYKIISIDNFAKK